MKLLLKSLVESKGSKCWLVNRQSFGMVYTPFKPEALAEGGVITSHLESKTGRVLRLKRLGNRQRELEINL